MVFKRRLIFQKSLKPKFSLLHTLNSPILLTLLGLVTFISIFVTSIHFFSVEASFRVWVCQGKSSFRCAYLLCECLNEVLMTVRPMSYLILSIFPFENSSLGTMKLVRPLTEFLCKLKNFWTGKNLCILTSCEEINFQPTFDIICEKDWYTKMFCYETTRSIVLLTQ